MAEVEGFGVGGAILSGRQSKDYTHTYTQSVYGCLRVIKILP